MARERAAQALAGPDPEQACQALLSLALHDADWRWVQARCVEATRSPDRELRRTAAVCFGHLARLHRQLDLDQVRPVLDALKNDPATRGSAEDALDDIATFIRPQPAPRR